MPVAEDVPPATMEHSAHPGHKLKRVGKANNGRFFMCHGCKEPGAGTRYRCEDERCNFDLHTCCAVAPDTLTQPLLGDRVLVFLLEAPDVDTTAGGKATDRSRVCVAGRGFVYHCFDEELDIHPCCASLPEHAAQDNRVVALQQEVSCSRDMTGDNNRGREIRPWASHPADQSGERNSVRERRPPAARHRR